MGHLLIVIVNYRTPNLTINCLHSLVSEVHSLPGTRVIVVDNASGDRSVELITSAIAKEGWQDWVEVIANQHNGGYAFGNNTVIRRGLASSSPPDYFWLLNPDTIVRPNALKILVDFMKDNPQVGIAGSRLENADNTLQVSAFRFHNLLSELDRGLRLGIISKLLDKWIVPLPIVEKNCQVDWVSGASMIIRREVFETVGLMDEGYFLYYEEVDLCLQANQANWCCYYVPTSKVVHFKGQSTGIKLYSKTKSKRLPQYWFDSRQRFFRKNYGFFYAALADIFWLIGFLTWRVRQVIQRKPDNDPPQLLSDFISNLVFFKLKEKLW